MYKYVFTLILAGLAINPAVADHAVSVHLPPTVFEDDGGDTVHIIGLKVGSPAEESSVPGMKTSVELWCNSKDCDSNEITIHVHGDVVDVYRPRARRYATQSWETSRILAEYDTPCGGRETWVIDREKRTAELFGYPCKVKGMAPNEIPAPWHYTLEFSR